LSLKAGIAGVGINNIMTNLYFINMKRKLLYNYWLKMGAKTVNFHIAGTPFWTVPYYQLCLFGDIGGSAHAVSLCTHANAGLLFL
jgi:hypothetical protein